MAILAKMFCESNEGIGWRGHEGKTQENVKLQAVYSDDPDSENYSFSQATPSGSLELTIDNPEAFGYFEPGAEYRVEIRKTRSA